MSFLKFLGASNSINYLGENTPDPVEGTHYELFVSEYGYFWEGLGEYDDLIAPCYFTSADEAACSAETAILTCVCYA
jgi:hypothetical protein